MTLNGILWTNNGQLLFWLLFSLATIGSFSLGTVLAWSSPALPDLAEREDLGVLSAKDKSWIASLAVVSIFSIYFSSSSSMEIIAMYSRRPHMCK